MFNLQCFTAVIIVMITNLRLEYRQKIKSEQRTIDVFYKCSGTRCESYLFILKVIVGMVYSWPFAFFIYLRCFIPLRL